MRQVQSSDTHRPRVTHSAGDGSAGCPSWVLSSPWRRWSLQKCSPSRGVVLARERGISVDMNAVFLGICGTGGAYPRVLGFPRWICLFLNGCLLLFLWEQAKLGMTSVTVLVMPLVYSYCSFIFYCWTISCCMNINHFTVKSCSTFCKLSFCLFVCFFSHGQFIVRKSY